MPKWDLIENFDSRLFLRGYGAILLDLPNEMFESRSFFRPEMESQNWQVGLIEWYGSQEKAVEAFIQSQEMRREFFRRTALPVLKIDTSKCDWDLYIDQILNFILSR